MPPRMPPRFLLNTDLNIKCECTFKITSGPGSNFFFNLEEPLDLAQGLIVFFHSTSGPVLASHFKTPGLEVFRKKFLGMSSSKLGPVPPTYI